MNTERLLVAKTVHSGAIEQMLGKGIESEHFDDQTLGKIWSFLAEHTRQYKQAPSLAVVREKFPDHNFEVATDSLDYLKDRFIQEVRRRYYIESVKELADLYDTADDDANYESFMLDKARRLSSIIPSAGETHRFSDMDQRVDAYQNASFEPGIMFGITAFDEATFGIQRHEYVTIMGWLGRGKSTLAQWIMFNAYQQGFTPMYISLEMGAQALLRKWDVMANQFLYNKFKKYELEEEELERYEQMATQVRARGNDIIVKDVTVDCTTDYVYAQMQRYKPDIVCIDYISLMKAQRAVGSSLWERVMHITNNLKQIARTTEIPIVGVAQTNRQGAKDEPDIDSIGYSIAIAQDSDIVVSLHNDEQMRENRQMKVIMNKNRDGPTTNTNLYWNMDQMEFRMWTPKDEFQMIGREAGLPEQERLVAEAPSG